jgi:hypothetical protein
VRTLGRGIDPGQARQDLRHNQGRGHARGLCSRRP